MALGALASTGPLLVSVLAGVLAGTITGLTPGIHINLINAAVTAPALSSRAPPITLASFIIAMSVTHSFLDSIPSVFLGAPDAATALGVLPGHRLVRRGEGILAVKYTLLGSLGAVAVSTLCFPVFLVIVTLAAPIFQAVMGWLLLSVASFMVLRDRHPAWALLVVTLAGALGLAVLQLPLANPLFPLLSGLFGVATLLYSLTATSALPPQRDDALALDARAGKALLSGQASGFLTAMLPGLGAGTAAALALSVTRRLGDEGYLVLQGSIGTVNFVLSLATVLALEKARNGSIVAVQRLVTLSPGLIALFLGVALCAAGLATVLALVCTRGFARLVPRLPYRGLVLAVIALITALTLVLSGWLGLLVLVTATAVGLIPAVTKTARVHAMACLLVPVTTAFLG